MVAPLLLQQLPFSSLLSSFLASLQQRVRPPGPFFQKINAILHQEPLSTILYGLYWSLLISIFAPIAVWILLGRTLLKMVAFVQERSEATSWATIASANEYDPKKKHSTSNQELAILVTGCDSGFGKEIVIWAAQAGYVVFAGCLQATSFAQFRDLPTVVPFHMDVTKAHHVDTAVTKVKEWLKEEELVVAAAAVDSAESSSPPQKQLESSSSTTKRKKDRIFHALINNAGIGYAGDIDWMTMEDIQKTMDVNFMGLVRCCKAFLPIFKEQSSSSSTTKRYYQGARILNLTSMAGLAPPAPLLGAYAASKFAAQAFSEALRLEVAAFHIQVATVNPSFHQTPICENGPAMVQQQWDKLPASVQDEYGSDYLERSKQLAHEMVTRARWDMAIVVDQVMQSLKCSHVPARILVGSDARFLLIGLRMFPEWVTEQLFEVAFSRPLPAVLKNSGTATESATATGSATAQSQKASS